MIATAAESVPLTERENVARLAVMPRRLRVSDGGDAYHVLNRAAGPIIATVPLSLSRAWPHRTSARRRGVYRPSRTNRWPGSSSPEPRPASQITQTSIIGSRPLPILSLRCSRRFQAGESRTQPRPGFDVPRSSIRKERLEGSGPLPQRNRPDDSLPAPTSISMRGILP
jgi:hypothetical protein